MKVESDVATIKALLRDHGLHATSARIAALQILIDEHHHHSVEELRAQVLDRYPAIDPATVYRTLETLEEHGLAVRMELGDKRARWAFMTHEHHHLVCRVCKATVELDDVPFQQLADQLSRSYGVVVDMQHLVLRGLCPMCAEAES